MFGSILSRMIFAELVKVFLLSLVAITGLFLLAGILAEASQRGLSPSQVLMVIPLITPSSLPYTLPATTLFATCVVYGRLAADNEILAVKSAGISVLQVVWPGILLGACATLLTVGLYYETIPVTHHLLRNRVLADVEEYLYGLLKRDGRISHPNLNYVIYVNRVQGRKLVDAQFMRRDPKGQSYDLIARAREAELVVDLPNRQIQVHMRHCYVTSSDPKEAQGYVDDRKWPVDLPDDLVKQTKFRAASMTWPELLRHKAQIENDIEGIEVDMTAHQAVIDMGTPPGTFAKHVQDQQNIKRSKQGELRNVEVELHMRPALALGCLCFVLVGCPVGIWFSRSDYLSAFITCFIPIVLVYYPLLLCGVNLGKAGTLSPLTSIWIADALLGVCALFLFKRLLRN
jgi:lipopolysaccharide export system permease protein